MKSLPEFTFYILKYFHDSKFQRYLLIDEEELGKIYSTGRFCFILNLVISTDQDKYVYINTRATNENG